VGQRRQGNQVGSGVGRTAQPQRRGRRVRKARAGDAALVEPEDAAAAAAQAVPTFTVANGIATLIDEKTQFRNFFDDSEVLFYNNIYHLSEIINSNKGNIKKLNRIGKNGKKRYFEIFDNKIVTQYILKKIFNIKNTAKMLPFGAKMYSIYNSSSQVFDK
jgi:hypothetical protein